MAVTVINSATVNPFPLGRCMDQKNIDRRVRIRVSGRINLRTAESCQKHLRFSALLDAPQAVDLT
jgi:hypothetical protein